jgi:quercetin dioxygenase-like cupin family protein
MDKITVLKKKDAPIKTEAWGQLTWFANKALGNSIDMSIGQCLIKPGQANPRHYHPDCTEILVVTKGQVRHTLDNTQDVDLDEGDTVTVPAGITHQARNIGEQDAVLAIAFSSAERKTVGV